MCIAVTAVTLRYETSPRAVAYDIVVASVFCREKSGAFAAALMVALD
jgi:hypothetical protein